MITAKWVLFLMTIGLMTEYLIFEPNTIPGLSHRDTLLLSYFFFGLFLLSVKDKEII